MRICVQIEGCSPKGIPPKASYGNGTEVLTRRANHGHHPGKHGLWRLALQTSGSSVIHVYLMPYRQELVLQVFFFVFGLARVF